MNQQDIIKRMEKRAKLAGVSINAACKSAGISPSTFFRWKKTKGNPDPVGANLKSLIALDAALIEMEREAEEERRQIAMQRRTSGVAA